MRSCHHFRIFDSVQLFSGSLCDRGSPAPQSKCPNRSAIMWCLTPPHRSNSSNTIERACSIRCRHSNSSNCFVISPKRLVRIRLLPLDITMPVALFLRVFGSPSRNGLPSVPRSVAIDTHALDTLGRSRFSHLLQKPPIILFKRRRLRASEALVHAQP